MCEKIIRKQPFDFLKHNEIISSQKSGFRPLLSIETTLMQSGSKLMPCKYGQWSN